MTDTEQQPFTESTIDVAQIIDATISASVRANLPPLPAVIAETLTRVLCQHQSATEHAMCFAQLLIFTRPRIEFFAGVHEVVN